MSHVLVLGRGWVGAAVEAAARRHPDVAEVTAIDPPLHPDLVSRDAAAADHLRTVVADGAVTAVINACGRVEGSEAELEDANLHFVDWLLDALDGRDVRLVHVGSASELGDPGSDQPVPESFDGRPVGAYATTKAAGTSAVLAAHRAGVDATVARVFNIVGHPPPAASPIGRWLADLAALGAAGGAVDVWWPPTTRDFVLLDEFSQALDDLALLDGPAPALLTICSGVGLRYGEIVEALASATGVPATVHSLARPGIPAVVGDPALLQATLGWAPAMSLAALVDGALGGRGTGGEPGVSR
jgi:nucleoside-diphosphate-sugar epimerase